MAAKKTISLAGASRLIGTPKQTIQSAAQRGESRTLSLARGAVVYPLEDVQRWAQVERKRGPKPV